MLRSTFSRRHKKNSLQNNKRKPCRTFETLERRELMAADFKSSYYIDRHDIGGIGETAFVADFNGDKLADIGVYIANGTKDARWVIKFNQGNGTFKEGTQYDFDRRDIGGEGETPLVGDFNGDGLADMGVYIPNGTKEARWVVKFNQGNGRFRAGTNYDIDRRDIGGEGETPLVGDFNGDGLADMGVYIPNGTKEARWVVKFNQNKDGMARFRTGTNYDIDRRDIGGEGETPVVGDFNADGLSDIGVSIPTGDQEARWVVKFNQNKDGMARFRTGTNYDIDRRDIGGFEKQVLVGDFNGDKRADIGVYVPNGREDARWVAVLGLEVPDKITASFDGGTLLIQGTVRPDQILVRQINRNIFVSGISIKTSAGNVDSVDAGLVKRIIVDGFSGDDTIDLNSGATKGLQEITVPTIIHGGAGNDRLIGGAAGDALYGDRGSDVLEGGKGNDNLYGGDGRDTYYFAGRKLGSDQVFDLAGQEHNELDFSDMAAGVTVDLARTFWQIINKDLSLKLQSEEVIDWVMGSDFGNAIKGNELNNQIFGGTGDDEIYGRGGDDWLYGGNGDDTLVGGEGRDHIFGGGGRDTFPEMIVSTQDFSFTKRGGGDQTKEQTINVPDNYTLVSYDMTVSSAQHVVGPISSVVTDSSGRAIGVKVRAELHPGPWYDKYKASAEGTVTMYCAPIEDIDVQQ